MTPLKLKSRNVVCTVVIAVAINAAITSAQAQETGPYATIGAGYATSSADQIEPVRTDTGLVQLRVGYGLNRYLAVEADASFSAINGELDPNGVTNPEGALNLSRSFAGYVVARYPIAGNVTLFARGGYHHSRLTLRATDLRQSTSVDNYAFGGGAVYRWGRNGVRADYTVLNVTRENFDQRVIGLSFVRRF